MTNTQPLNNKKILASVVKSIQKYSKDFNEAQRILDIPWVEVSYRSGYRKFIFTHNNKLIVSVSGRVIIGEWNLIPLANSLLLTFQDKSTLYNRFFLDDALLILKIDGLSDEYFILANENKIPNLKIEKYIHSKYLLQYHEDVDNTPLGRYQYTFLLSNGNTLKFKCRKSSPVPKSGDTPYIDGKIAKDGRYLLKNNRTIIEIKDRMYFRKLTVKSYQLKNKGLLKVEQNAAMGMRKGDKVWLNDQVAPDGKYKVGWLNYLKVKNGIII